MDKKGKPVQAPEGERSFCTCAFARRMYVTPKSFIREVLKVTENPDIISFTGGLPNPCFIGVGGLSQAAADVFRDDGRTTLQYSTTEGIRRLGRVIRARSG